MPCVSVAAGVSFELKHFQEVYFYGFAGLGTVRSATQMIARVRDISTETIHVFIAKGDAFSPVMGKQTPPLYPVARTYEGATMAILRMLERHRHQEAACSSVGFPYYFWALAVHSGGRIVFPAAPELPMPAASSTPSAPEPSVETGSSRVCDTGADPFEAPGVKGEDGGKGLAGVQAAGRKKGLPRWCLCMGCKARRKVAIEAHVMRQQAAAASAATPTPPPPTPVRPTKAKRDRVTVPFDFDTNDGNEEGYVDGDLTSKPMKKLRRLYPDDECDAGRRTCIPSDDGAADTAGGPESDAEVSDEGLPPAAASESAQVPQPSTPATRAPSTDAANQCQVCGTQCATICRGRCAVPEGVPTLAKDPTLPLPPATGTDSPPGCVSMGCGIPVCPMCTPCVCAAMYHTASEELREVPGTTAANPESVGPPTLSQLYKAPPLPFAADTYTPTVCEHWWDHDWEKDPEIHLLDNALDSSVSVTGTLLERVGKVPPDYLVDVGLVPTWVPGNVTFAFAGRDEGSILPKVAPELVPRIRAWALLMARKLVTISGAPTKRSADWSPRATPPPSPDAPAVPGTTAAAKTKAVYLHPPPFAMFNLSKSHAVLGPRFDAHLKSFGVIDGGNAVTWLELSLHAWVLAGMEVAFRTGTEPCPEAVFSTIPGTTGLKEIVSLHGRIQELVSAFRPWQVDVGGAVGCPPSDEPGMHRFHPSSGLVDLSIVDVDGGLHLVQFRITGCAEHNAVTDLTKLRVLASMEARTVDTITVAYLGARHVVRVRVEETLPHDRLPMFARSSPATLEPWNPTAHVTYVWVRSLVVLRGSPPVFRGFCLDSNTGAVHEVATLEQVRGYAERFATHARRWVCWGLRKWMAAAEMVPEEQADVLPLCVDLEAIVESRLRVSLPHEVLDIQRANVTNVSLAEAGGQGPCPVPQLDLLRNIHMGLCKSMFMVYFWNGRPQGVFLPSLHPFV